MTTTVAPHLKPDHYESEVRLVLQPVPAETTPEEPDADSFDPTQGRQIGSLPYDDPTQGRKVGSDPHEELTQGQKIGSDSYDDPTQGQKIGADPYDDPTRAR